MVRTPFAAALGFFRSVLNRAPPHVYGYQQAEGVLMGAPLINDPRAVAGTLVPWQGPMAPGPLYAGPGDSRLPGAFRTKPYTPLASVGVYQFMRPLAPALVPKRQSPANPLAYVGEVNIFNPAITGDQNIMATLYPGILG